MIEKKKKKVILLSNFSKQFTGFGRHSRAVLGELYKSGEYDLVEVACGISYSNNILKSVPWPCFGTIPDNPQDYAHFQNDPHKTEAMFFGAFMIDKIIRDEKPDAIILVEDIWKIAWAFWKPWFNKIPTLIHTPIDSSPVLPLIRDNKERLKNIWVKTDFAVKDLAGIGIESKAVPLLTDQSMFRPLPKEQREEVRKFCGLEDSFVIGFVFRNQLRKLVVSLLRGFKEFQDKYPDSKAKLLLHTNFEEGQTMGWRIMESAGVLGINPDDILCTYVCHSCRVVRVIPFKGFALNCDKCGGQGSVRNPNIELGVTDEELNVVYNLMDFYCHPATSGGFEGPMSEASLVGLPTATCNYAFGETFCSAHALTIDHTIYDERESGFMKSQPKQGEICRVMEEVYNNRDKYREIGLESREWALKKFDLKEGVQHFKDWIDNSVNTFDYEFYELKNVDYPPDYSIVENAAFIVDLINGIHGMELKTDHPDVQKWCADLIQQSREEIVRRIKDEARRINQELKPPVIQDFIVKSDNKKLILVCSGGAIECYNTLAFLDWLKEEHPGWDFYISVRPEFLNLFDHLEEYHFIPFHEQMLDLLGMEGRDGWPGIFDKALILPQLQHHNGL